MLYEINTTIVRNNKIQNIRLKAAPFVKNIKKNRITKV
jgi:hypothetical protein